MTPNEDPNGYVIGIREVYMKLEELATKVATLTENLNLRVQGIEYKLTEAERRITEMEADFEESGKERANTHRQIVLAIVSSLILPVIVGLVVWYFTSK
jgi:hypothetical protein